jgi:hypothetical protein
LRHGSPMLGWRYIRDLPAGLRLAVISYRISHNLGAMQNLP